VRSAALQAGAGLMTLGAVAFVGYAAVFFVRNFTDGFLELGIGPGQVDTGKDAIRAFSPDLYHYVSHLHLAVSGSLAATGLAVAALSWFGVRRGLTWAWAAAVAAPARARTVARRDLPRRCAAGAEGPGRGGEVNAGCADRGVRRT
jgi:hypothetical protein